MRKRFHTETSAGGAHGQDRPTLSVFDDNATLTGDVAAVRQMLPGLWVQLISQAHIFLVDGLLFFRRFAIGADHIGIVEHFLVKKIGVILGGRWPLATCAVSYRRGHASIFPFPVAEMFHISSRCQQPQLGIERPRPTHDLGAWRSVPGGGSGAVGPLNQPAHRDLRDYALLLARVLLGDSLDIGNSDEAIAVPAGYPTLLE